MFSNAVMLAGIGGAAVPLVLHYLGRIGAAEVSWGAMMFLPGSDSARPNRARARQRVLLTLRMLIVSTLAVALARPVYMKPPGLLGRPGGVAVVVLLDRSASMGAEDAGQTRLDVAKRAVLAVLARLNRGDEVALILVGDDAATRPQFTTDLQRVASEIVQMRPSSLPGDIASGLTEARRLLRANAAPNRLLFMATDRQASGWAHVTPNFLAEWSDGRPPIDFIATTVTAGSSNNLAVTALKLPDPPLIRNVPIEYEITVQNFSSSRRVGVPVTLSSNSTELHRSTIDILPGGTATARGSLTLSAAGSQILTAAIESDDVGFDNFRSTAIEVVDPIRVLVISGTSAAPVANPRVISEPAVDDLLIAALSPHGATGAPGFDSASVHSVAGDPWPDLLDGGSDVVILANLSTVTPRQVRTIERFIYSGGGVLVAPGNLTRVDPYNDAAWRDGSGFLPAPLEPPVDGKSPTSLMQIDPQHPVFQSVGAADAVPNAVVRRYFPVFTIPPGGRAIATFRSGEPFLIDRPFGKGRVLMTTTPLDLSWNSLPLSEFYLSFLQPAVHYLAGGNAPRRNLQPGQPIKAELTGIASDRVSLTLPSGDIIPLEVAGAPGKGEVHFPDTRTPGSYEIHYRSDQSDRTIYFVVAVSASESDPQTLSNSQWSVLSKTLGFQTLPPEPARLAAALRPAGERRELWPMLLAAVVALGLLELFLSRNWTARECDDV